MRLALATLNVVGNWFLTLKFLAYQALQFSAKQVSKGESCTPATTINHPYVHQDN
jgi:hypothetical protein